MLNVEEKSTVIKKFQVHGTDTGSTAVQVAVLSEEIDKLLSHLKKNPKDFHSKRGLLKMVQKRRKFLEYLNKKDQKQYKEVIKQLGLKK